MSKRNRQGLEISYEEQTLRNNRHSIPQRTGKEQSPKNRLYRRTVEAVWVIEKYNCNYDLKDIHVISDPLEENSYGFERCRKKSLHEDRREIQGKSFYVIHGKAPPSVDREYVTVRTIFDHLDA